MLIYQSQLSTNWDTFLLSEVVEFLDNQRKAITERDRVKGPYPYYGANGQQDSVAEFIFDEPLVLLAEDGGHFGDPNKTIAYQITGKCWVNNHAHVLRPKDCIDIRYLYRHLERYDVTPFVTGTTRGKLTKSAASRIPIVVPPLEEQRRIAAILDKADDIRRKRKRAIALTEELLRSTFLDMFGDPVTNPKGWPYCNLSELLSIVSGQINPQADPYVNMQHIGCENIHANTGQIIGVKTPKELKLHSGKYLFEPTDVLYSKIRPYLNKVTIPGFTGVCSADIYPLRVKESKLDQRFLVYMLRSNLFLTYAEKHSTRTNIPKINRLALLNFNFPYPPLTLQKQFSVIYSKVDSLRNRIEYSCQDLDNLFNSLLQKAFRGEL
ncbi:restriction endonuclease subunit S [Anabaena sp. CS-542/02]|uniref:restriction endonuclease subunit S n=1 Tax=Anabaena sp. CS-542/02 TaxID=3021719 RepID=UPI00233092CD|nr:restriction endonuclease subunit S [Anabaena sp. CS-542/02]MDB9446942.1 restriction endonuclease subunit S [Anabaena sp. CS-542/02]